jgi:hypothetical protein
MGDAGAMSLAITGFAMRIGTVTVRITCVAINAPEHDATAAQQSALAGVSHGA